jgi:hypothetical protein
MKLMQLEHESLLRKARVEREQAERAHVTKSFRELHAHLATAYRVQADALLVLMLAASGGD